MRKIIILTFITSAFLANVSAQLVIKSSGEAKMETNSQNYKLTVEGDTYVTGNILLGSTSKFLGTTKSSDPITFKTGNMLVGFTGSSANNNVSFGYGALSNSLTGGHNVAVGFQALYSNIAGGNFNTANGYQALYYNMTGNQNTANGYRTLYDNTEGCDNTANGFGALRYNTKGKSNVANGNYALFSNETGNGNTAIGHSANVGGPNLSNATAIGYGAKVYADNTIALGNTTVSHLYFAGTLTHHSDGRAKKNIRSGVPGLAFIKQLQPVMYNFDLDALDELEKSDDPKINAFNDSLRNARSPEEKAIDAKARADKEKIVYSGFIAQDVEKAARSVGYDFSGIDVPKNGKGAYGLGYSEFVVPLVKAVQELSEQNALLTEAMKEQQAQIEKQQLQIDELQGNCSLRSTTNETEITGITDAIVAQCKLYQNAPNPFNQKTQIRFYIPENIKLAQLCIYNLQGTQIKQIIIPQRGESSQWISGSELSAGMYLYALIVDGKEVDVKRMILTK